MYSFWNILPYLSAKFLKFLFFYLSTFVRVFFKNFTSRIFKKYTELLKYLSKAEFQLIQCLFNRVKIRYVGMFCHLRCRTFYYYQTSGYQWFNFRFFVKCRTLSLCQCWQFLLSSYVFLYDFLLCLFLPFCCLVIPLKFLPPRLVVCKTIVLLVL